MAKPLLKGAKTAFSKIEKALYTAPAFINAVKAAVPDVTLQAVLTDEQKQQIAKGALKLMTKKDGSLMANLINPETKKIVTTIPLKSVQMAPEMTQAMTSFSTQMQMAQIAEEIQAVQLAVEEVRMGQEYDRLATAYSCQQKLLQAMEIKNSELKAMALMQLAAAAKEKPEEEKMKKESDVRVCKNKKCQKVLPAGYKHRYCEACRNKHAQTAKNVLRGIGAGAATVASVAVVVVTGGKINSKK